MISSDRILAVLGGGMILAALVLLVLGGVGDGDGRPAGTEDPPPLDLISPADGATVEGPLEVVFRTSGQMEPLPGGWGVGDHHVHLELDGVELMPADADIERLDGGQYRWSLPGTGPGPHALRLLWSGPDHRPMPETATPLVRVQVR